MVITGFIAKPDQFFGNRVQLVVEVAEATVAAEADDGLYRPLNLQKIAEMLGPESSAHRSEAGHLIELTIH